MFYVLCLLVFSTVWAQEDISSIEYYYDTDPGVGMATVVDINPDVAVLDANYVFPTTGLSVGAHILYMRLLDAAGEPTLTVKRNFTIQSAPAVNTSDITQVEYFYDIDPGVGMGNSLAVGPSGTINENLSLATAALATGSHRLYVRTGNAAGTYSLYDAGTFSIIAAPPQNTANISAIEYFFDTDPGVGSATQITISQAASIDENVSFITTGQPVGNYLTYLRVGNTDGDWSHYDRKNYSVIDAPPVNTADIIGMEYFFNTDPGVGNATPIAVGPTADLDVQIAIPTASLPIGSQQLFLRVMNADGTYSLYDRVVTSVQVDAPINTADITGAEFFFDQDPGIGNGFQVPVPTSSTADENFTFTTSGLAIGDHNVFVRVRSTDGTWGLYAVEAFTVDGTLAAGDEELASVAVYPNPASSLLNVTLSQKLTLEHAYILDSLGRVVLNQPSGVQQWDITSLSSGSYLLVMKTSKGKVTKRFIKQ